MFSAFLLDTTVQSHTAGPPSAISTTANTMQNQNRSGAPLDSPMPRRQSCDRCHGQKVRCFTSGPEDIFEPGGQADDEVSLNGHFVSSYPCLRCEKAGALCVFSAQLRPGRPILPRDPSSNVPSRKRARTASSRASPSNLASPSHCSAQLSPTSNPFFSSMMNLGDPSLVSQRSLAFHNTSDFPVDPLLLTSSNNNNNNTHQHMGFKPRGLPLRDNSHDDSMLFNQQWLPSPGLHEQDMTFPTTPIYPNPPTSIPGPIQILPQTVVPHETTIFASPTQHSPTATPTTTVFPTPTTATFSTNGGWDQPLLPNTHLEDLTSICRRVHRAASTLPGGPSGASLWPLTAPSVNDLFDAACSLVHLADQHAASKAAAPHTPSTYPFPPSPTPSPTNTNPSPMSSPSPNSTPCGISAALDSAFHILATSCHSTVVAVFDDMAGCFLEYMHQTGKDTSSAGVLPQISITVNLMGHLLTQMSRAFAAGGIGGHHGSGMNTPTSPPGLMHVSEFGADEFGDLNFGGTDFDSFQGFASGDGEQQRQARVRAKVRMVKAMVEGMGVL